MKLNTLPHCCGIVEHEIAFVEERDKLHCNKREGGILPTNDVELGRSRVGGKYPKQYGI